MMIDSGESEEAQKIPNSITNTPRSPPQPFTSHSIGLVTNFNCCYHPSMTLKILQRSKDKYCFVPCPRTPAVKTQENCISDHSSRCKKDGIYYDDSDDRQKEKDKTLALIASTRHRRRWRRRRPTGKLGLFGSLRSRPPQGQSLCNILVGFCVAILATVIFNAELTTQRPIYKRSADSLTGAMVRENHQSHDKFSQEKYYL